MESINENVPVSDLENVPAADSGKGHEEYELKREKFYLTPKEMAAYSFTSLGQNMLNSMVGSKQYFMINYLRLTGNQFGLMSLLANVWDALDDPISGVVIDRCRTRWGRLRPFLLFPIPLWAITSILFFIAPGFNAPMQKMVYATVITIINGMGWSYFNGWNLLLYNLTPNINERSRLLATTKFVGLFNWLPPIVPVLVDFLPGLTDNKITQSSVYSGAATFFVLCAVAASIFGFYNMRERVPMLSKQEMKENSIWDSVKLVIKNPPLFVLLLSQFFGGIKGVGGASEDFFWFNCTGKLSNRFLASLFTGMANYVITPVAPKIVRKFGTRTTAITAGVFSGIAYALLYVIGYSPTKNHLFNFIIITVMLTVAGIPNYIMGFCDPLLTGDMYDYLEWKSGFRSEGLVNAVSGYINKLSGSVHAYLSGAVFDWIKFSPQNDKFGNVVPHPDPKVLQGIFGIFCLAPAVARAGYGLALLMFKVHGKFKADMQRDLAERRSERAATG